MKIEMNEGKKVTSLEEGMADKGTGPTGGRMGDAKQKAMRGRNTKKKLREEKLNNECCKTNEKNKDVKICSD